MNGYTGAYVFEWFGRYQDGQEDVDDYSRPVNRPLQKWMK